MSYNVHNFRPGAVLYAEQLNEMDAQIQRNDQRLLEVSEDPDKVWSSAAITFVKNSGNIDIGTELENGATYTMFANVVSDDTDSDTCRIYLVQQNGDTGSAYFFIGRGTEKIVVFTVPDNGIVYDKLLFYAAISSTKSEGDTATFSNIRLVKGDYPQAYPPPSAVDRVLRERATYGEQTKWLALGDSITLGVYSFVNGNSTSEAVGTGWVQRLAYYLGYELRTFASRGMGYTAEVTGRDPADMDARISLSTLLERAVALEDEFNLITLAFGVNDYNTPSSATLTTVAAGLNSAIETLAARWPMARIVVITPFNCCNTEGCTLETRWNCDFARGDPGRTLADIAHKIQECCDAKNVECINCTENFVLNVYNISKTLSNAERLLPDKVHPSLAAHALIAKTMVHHLLF